MQLLTVDFPPIDQYIPLYLRLYKNMLLCQYHLLVTGMCEALKVYANESAYTAYHKLTEVCDIQFPQKEEKQVTDPSAVTHDTYCSTILDELQACSEEVQFKLSSYTIPDWRDNSKVLSICKWARTRVLDAL